MKSEQNKSGSILYNPKLGKRLYELGNRYVCEGGIWEKKKYILWDDIDTLYLEATKTTVEFILPAGESITLQVRDKIGTKIDLKLGAMFRIGRNNKEDFMSVYQFIVSQIIDRQLEELLSSIKESRRVSFQSFDITSSAIYRKKLFGGYDIIELYRILGCDFDNGEFIIKFVDDKGHLKSKKSGYVREIPNLHLAQTFILLVAQNNIKALNDEV